MLIRLHLRLCTLKVDTNADAVADIAYRFTFSPTEDGVQKATVRSISVEKAKGSGNDGDILFQDVPVYFGKKQPPFKIDMNNFAYCLTGNFIYISKHTGKPSQNRFSIFIFSS